MDRRRAAGALLALAACIACTTAAPAASNQTALDLYEGDASEGCYYNFQHYGEGDRIMTNEPCLNCTCHNRMLMCYLRVCPFTKPIGSDCTVEKRADQCCPIVTCPDVPVDLLTSTSTSSPAEYGTTGVGRLDKYGCSINGKYFAEGSKVPPSPDKPCEHCYCIRNMTTCVMQECTLHVDGCTPIYHKEVCCPVRYSCDHPEDEVPLLDDMTTTVRPTPGFLLTTTQIPSVTQIPQDCVHDDEVFPDGTLIKTEKACEHCYCMKGDIVCVVQECGTPMENEGKNCTSIPPREGQCCPDTYICEGDNELPPEDITTLEPPRRTVEGSGYRTESEDQFTEQPFEHEGSGEEQTEKIDDRTTPRIEDFTTPGATKEESEDYPTTEKIMHDKELTTETPEIYTTEPDKSENTVPSDIFEHETTASVPEIAKEKTTSDIEIDSTTESYTSISHRIDVTSEVDVPKLTTEPTSRKDDDKYSVSEQSTTERSESLSTVSEEQMITVQPKEQTSTTLEDKEIELTTILAPSDINKEETLSTTIPTLEDKTEPEIIDTKVTTTQFDEHLPTTTGRIYLPETTSVNPIENEIDEENIPMISPGMIPGEGNCLVNGVTYDNNSVVSSNNKCQSNCKCVSSIVKCDPVICDDPPQDMMNCRLIEDDESCCPNYICDKPKETTPLVSHNQVSGTVTEQAIECTEEQCIQDTETPTKVSPQCTSDKCTVENVEKDNTDCGSLGCDGQLPIPESHNIPEQHPEVCLDGKCISTGAGCVGENCQTQTQEKEACNNEGGCEKVPVEKCEGAHCEAATPPLKDGEICSNQEGCVQTPTETKCEGGDCTDFKQDCVGENCKTIPPSEENKTQDCSDKNNCETPTKSDDKQGPECNDESCTKKEASELGNKFGTECKDESCLPPAIPTSSEIIVPTTDSIITEKEETLAPVITDTGATTPEPLESITTEIPEDEKLGSKLPEQTTPVIDYVTDEGQKEKTPSTEQSILDNTQEQKVTTETLESITESESIDMVKPKATTETSITDTQKQESTELPEFETTDQIYTDKQTPVESYDGSTTRPEIEQSTFSEKSTDTPATTKVSLSDEEHKEPETVESITPVIELTTIADKQVTLDSSERPAIKQDELETEQPEMETIKPSDITDYNQNESTTVQDEVMAQTTEISALSTESAQTEQPNIYESDLENLTKVPVFIPPGSTVSDQLDIQTSVPDTETTEKQYIPTSYVTKSESEVITSTPIITKVPEDFESGKDVTKTSEKIDEDEVTTKQSEDQSTVSIKMEEQVTTTLPIIPDESEPESTGADIQPHTTLTPDVVSYETPEVQMTETINTETSTTSPSEVTIPESSKDQEKQTLLPETTKPSEGPKDSTTLPELFTQTSIPGRKETSELPDTESPILKEQTDEPLETTEEPQAPTKTSDQEKETEATTIVMQTTDFVTVLQETVTEPSIKSEEKQPDIPDDSVYTAPTEIPATQEKETKSPLEITTDITVDEKLTETPEFVTQNPLSETTEQFDKHVTEITDVDHDTSPVTISIITDDQKTATPEILLKPSEPTLIDEEKIDTEVTKEDGQVTDSAVPMTSELTPSEKEKQTDIPVSVTITPFVADQEEKSTETPVDIIEIETTEALPERRTGVPEVVTHSPDLYSQGESESATESPVVPTQPAKSAEEHEKETGEQVSTTQLPESELSTQIPQGMTETAEEEKTTKISEVEEVTEKVVETTQNPEHVVSPDHEIDVEALTTTESSESDTEQKMQTEIPADVTEPAIMSSSPKEQPESSVDLATEVPKESEEAEKYTVPPDENTPPTDTMLVTNLEEQTKAPEIPSTFTESSQESSTETRLVPEEDVAQNEFTTPIPEDQELKTEIPKESTTTPSITEKQETEFEEHIATTEYLPPKKEETTEIPELSIPVEVATEIAEIEKHDVTTTSAPLPTEELETFTKSQSTALPTDTETQVDTETPVISTLPPLHQADSQKESTSEAPVSSTDIPEIDITKSPEEPFSTTMLEYTSKEIEPQPTTISVPIVSDTDGSSAVTEETVASKITDITETPAVPSEDISKESEHTTSASEKPSFTEQDVTTKTPQSIELETITPSVEKMKETTPYEESMPEKEASSVTSSPERDVTIAETDSKTTENPEEPITTPDVVILDQAEPKLTTEQVPTEGPISLEPSSASPDLRETDAPASASESPVTENISKETETSETTPYSVELDEHTYKIEQEPITTVAEEITSPFTKKDIMEPVTTEKIIEYSTESGDLDSKFSIPVSPVSEEQPSKEETKSPTTTIASETEQQTTETPVKELESHEIITTPSAELTTTEASPVTPDLVDKHPQTEEKPTVSQSTVKPTSSQPSDEPPEEESGQFPPTGSSGYGQEPDYGEEDQTFGPGTCRYGGKVYVSAQQIPREDPCDFCFCFRSDIICLQQSCPPPIHGCHEEPIQGFCCPRYECPVSMATTLNVTTTTTTTTTTLPPHFLAHAYNGAAQRRGCQIKGQTYKVGEVVRASSGPCLHCTCGGDGQMKCDPKVCTPEPMLRQMIAAAVSAKRRR